MNPQNFCFWLQGFMEIANPKELTSEQVQMIKNHLNLVKAPPSPYSDALNYANTININSISVSC